MSSIERSVETRPRVGFAASRWVVRVLLSLTAVAAVAQPLTIGQYLDGRYALLQMHSAGAVALETFGLLLIPLVIWYVVAGGRVWVLITILLAVAIEVQAVMGYVRDLGVHIPLGVAVVGGAIVLTIWFWSPYSAKHRPRRARSAVEDAEAEPEGAVVG
ncbi:hypothetical protein [Microlunatus sp. Gsoil 973]|jgi:hypothetical protein|uniref:hypothetical protein n=1 Tax=Microlunatus sp. Gsoil 973 TaxID=2672569 RepID=UPI0012B459D1|nr:hypothetical protein [Microlunatus sp. Gsoil 973]QGN31604.1 hypothetical protein GJV80_00770 [Microlunatus sp. Gsoil 973]